MIYLDHNATTPLHPEVREAMLPWLDDEPGNPSSRHAFGRAAANAVDQARAAIADLIGANAGEIVFTSGGTESNNWAIFGTAAPHASGRVVTSVIEHPAVTGPLDVLQARGWTVDALGVSPLGIVDMVEAREVLTAEPAPVLLSVMTAHNETGAVQPVAGLTRIVRGLDARTIVHTDAAQAVGKIPVDVGALGVDLLTIAGHKLYAPKGIGALFIRSGVELEPLLYGGGQQGGRRPGTEPVAAIVGLGAACTRAKRELAAEAKRLTALRERLWAGLAAGISDVRRTLPDLTPCLPNTLHVCVPGRAGAAILDGCAEVLAASTGSACHADDTEAPGVLGAMAFPADVAMGALRLSLGASTDEAGVDAAIEALVAAATPSD